MSRARRPCCYCGGPKPPGRGVKRCENCAHIESRIPKEHQDEAIRLYVDEGMTTAAIGERLFWSPSAIARVLRNRGVQLRSYSERQQSYPNALAAGDLDRTVELYQSGLSVAEVAEALGRSHSTIIYRLDRAGVERRPVGQAVRLRRLHEMSAKGTAALTDRQRAALELLERNGPLTTCDLRQRLPLSSRSAAHVMRRLESFGLVKGKRTAGTGAGRSRPILWRRTDLPLSDVLSREIAQRRGGRAKDEDSLPIEPLRAMLHQWIDRERRKAQFMAVAGKDGTDGAGGITVVGTVARSLGIHERRLHAFLNQQETVSFDVADRILTHAGRGVTVFDLWPHLEPDDDEAAAA